MDSLILSNNFRYAGIDLCEFVNGSGVGATIYFQGCTHQCPGCHNPQTWDKDGGMVFGKGEIDTLKSLLSDNRLQRLTLSGGDPFDNIEMLAYLLNLFQAYNSSGKKIWVYTGYTFEELVAHGYEHLLAQIDYLVDGRYIQEMRDLSIAFRGSSNQRIIDSKASVKNKKIKTVDLDTEEGK